MHFSGLQDELSDVADSGFRPPYRPKKFQQTCSVDVFSTDSSNNNDTKRDPLPV